MKTEKHLQDYLRRQCISAGMSFDKVESRSRAGFPDCFIAYEGIVVLVELKSPAGTGKVSALQKACIASLKDHGCWVEIIDSAEGVNGLIWRILKC
jgi:hypothetical protein